MSCAAFMASCFNPRSCVGSDARRRTQLLDLLRFNPRSCVGSDSSTIMAAKYNVYNPQIADLQLSGPEARATHRIARS